MQPALVSPGQTVRTVDVFAGETEYVHIYTKALCGSVMTLILPEIEPSRGANV